MSTADLVFRSLQNTRGILVSLCVKLSASYDALLTSLLQDAFASGSGGGSGKYLENGAVLTAAGIDETKRMLASKREVERTEGLKRVVAVRMLLVPDVPMNPAHSPSYSR